MVSRLIQHALSEGLTKGVKPVINSPAVTHLFFADDWPLFTEAKGTYIQNLISLISSIVYRVS